MKLLNEAAVQANTLLESSFIKEHKKLLNNPGILIDETNDKKKVKNNKV